MEPLIDHERRILALEKSLKDVQARSRGYAWGTWSPSFFGDGGTPGTFTYFANTGSYMRIGGLCIITGVVAISAITVAPTGNMKIANLPIQASSSATANGGVSFQYISNYNFSATAIQLTGVIIVGGNTISLYEALDNAGPLPSPAASFTNPTCNLQFFGMYQV